MVLFSFITGHFWIYPNTIAQSWDASLAHLHYFKLREEMNAAIDQEGYDRTKIGTFFPYNHSEETTRLNGNTIEFKPCDFDNDELIIESNVINDFSDNQLNCLQTDFLLVDSVSSSGIYLKLYRRK